MFLTFSRTSFFVSKAFTLDNTIIRSKSMFGEHPERTERTEKVSELHAEGKALLENLQ